MNLFLICSLVFVPLTTAAPGCGFEPLLECLSPLTEYTQSSRGIQVMTKMKQEPTYILSLSGDELTKMCIMYHDLASCLSGMYDRCFPYLVQMSKAVAGMADMTRSCKDPGFGEKARQALICFAKLNATSPTYRTATKKYAGFALSSSGMMGYAGASGTFDGNKKLDELCCAENEYYEATSWEYDSICGRDAGKLLHSLHRAQSESLNCDSKIKLCGSEVETTT